MKQKIIEIIYGSNMTEDQSDLKAQELIILFNAHLLEKARESNNIAELIEKTFINL
jgi:hypothetical protein